MQFGPVLTTTNSGSEGSSSEQQALSKERKIAERKQEFEKKHMDDELNDIVTKLRTFFTSKLEKNLIRISEKRQKSSQPFDVAEFCKF